MEVIVVAERLWVVERESAEMITVEVTKALAVVAKKGAESSQSRVEEAAAQPAGGQMVPMVMMVSLSVVLGCVEVASAARAPAAAARAPGAAGSAAAGSAVVATGSVGMDSVAVAKVTARLGKAAGAAAHPRAPQAASWEAAVTWTLVVVAKAGTGAKLAAVTVVASPAAAAVAVVATTVAEALAVTTMEATAAAEEAAMVAVATKGGVMEEAREAEPAGRAVATAAERVGRSDLTLRRSAPTPRRPGRSTSAWRPHRR